RLIELSRRIDLLAPAVATGWWFQLYPWRTQRGPVGRVPARRRGSRAGGDRWRRVHGGGRRALRPGQPVRAPIHIRELRDVRLRRRIVHAVHHPVEVDEGQARRPAHGGSGRRLAGAALVAAPAPIRRSAPT